jgi:hypothetical protein
MKLYEFPENAFSGYDQTKWGPTDFYSNTKEALAKAFKSRKSFETPWLSCKKEILSSRITRDKGTVTVEVSVSDDFDTPGMGSAQFTVNANTSEDEFFDLLENAGSAAWTEARENRKDNAVYVGYAVGREGPDGKRTGWEITYIVAVGEGAYYDAPPGDYYHRWGWQEVETDDDTDHMACPEEIPQAIADQLAEGMQDLEPVVKAGGWVATMWEE